MVVERNYQQNLLGIVRLFKDVVPLDMRFNRCAECAEEARRGLSMIRRREAEEVRAGVFDALNPLRFYFE